MPSFFAGPYDHMSFHPIFLDAVDNDDGGGGVFVPIMVVQ